MLHVCVCMHLLWSVFYRKPGENAVYLEKGMWKAHPAGREMWCVRACVRARERSGYILDWCPASVYICLHWTRSLCLCILYTNKNRTQRQKHTRMFCQQWLSVLFLEGAHSKSSNLNPLTLDLIQSFQTMPLIGTKPGKNSACFKTPVHVAPTINQSKTRISPKTCRGRFGG